MTTVTAVMRRPYWAGMFDDLNLPAHTRSFDPETKVTTLTFASQLTAPKVAAVFARMESVSDVDLTRRATLRAKRDAVIADPTIENVLALGVANANYQLGETP